MNVPKKLRVFLWGLPLIFCGAILVCAGVIWHQFIADRIVFTTQSTSPDGMFRCTLNEWSGFGGEGRYATVTIERRKGESAWEGVIVQEKVSPVDTSAPGCYYITWHGSQAVTILGDYGPGPIPKKVICN